jgi:hypothetical protein
MNTDTLARAAGDDLRAHTAMVDPEQGLSDLLVAHAHRRRTTRAAVVVAVAAAILAGWWGATTFSHHPHQVQPSRTPHGSAPTLPLVPQATMGASCESTTMACLGHRTYRFAMPAPVVWRIPPGFGVNSGDDGDPATVESWWEHDGNTAGVSVLEQERAAADVAEPLPARGVPATAQAIAHWIASRPFLVASAPRRTTVGGQTAWQVRAWLRDTRTPGPGPCTTYACHALVLHGTSPIGLWSDLVSDYTVVDLPGGGATVVWSWAFGHDVAALDLNRRLVAGLSFPHP